MHCTLTQIPLPPPPWFSEMLQRFPSEYFQYFPVEQSDGISEAHENERETRTHRRCGAENQR